MNTIILIYIIVFSIIIFNIFVYLLWKKINVLENIILNLFKRKNNQVISIYWISESCLVRRNDVFESFFKLKRQDFWESSYNGNYNSKIILYDKIHYEINFIIKACETHKKITENPNYNYIKDSILEKNYNISKRIKVLKKITKKYNLLSSISKFTIIWIFLN